MHVASDLHMAETPKDLADVARPVSRNVMDWHSLILSTWMKPTFDRLQCLA